MSTTKDGNRDFFVVPVFHKSLKDLVTSQGECLVMECRVKGVPPPVITWKREGYQIEDCPDFRMLHRGEVATLVIGEAFPEDSGTFTCEATNKAGTAETSCRLIVKGGGYHTISTKSAAAPQQYQNNNIQVLPLPTSQTSTSHHQPRSSSPNSPKSPKSPKSPTRISKFHIIPVQPPRNHIKPSSPSASTKSNSPSNKCHSKKSNYFDFNCDQQTSDNPRNQAQQTSVAVTPTLNLPPPCFDEPAQYISRSRSQSPCSFRSYHSASRDSTPLPSPPTEMSIAAMNALSFAEKPNEGHSFKEEKQQVVDDIAKAITSPTPKSPRQRATSSRTLAIIERDIEYRQHAEEQDIKTEGDYIVNSPTLAAVHGREPQEYKISAFDQRLMSEIEYRLERTPPINEEPEDGLYEDVPVQQQRRPAFTVGLKSIKMVLGTAAKFNCKAAGSPKPKVFWFKDGKQISKKSQHYIQKSDSNGNHELAIGHLTLEDDGNYTALAVNPQGRVSTTGRLLILDKAQTSNNLDTNPERTYRTSSPVSPLQPVRVTSPHITSSQLTSPRMLSPQSKPQTPTSPPVEYVVPPEKGELADDEQSPVEKYYRPTFIQKPPQDTNADEGKLVRFNVKVTGLPAPEIEWLINGRPVHQDALHKILVRENNVHSLLLERVSPMDEGQYSIVATNVAGTVTIHAQLHVAAREFMTAPAFVQRLSPQCAAQGDAIRLEARIVGAPKPVITWKKGSDQVMGDHRIQLYQDDTGYACLQITRAEIKDAAWYTCSATNKAGISSCNCKLDIYSPTCDVTTSRRRIRTPHRYASLAKVAGVDMREALTPDAHLHQHLPESEEL